MRFRLWTLLGLWLCASFAQAQTPTSDAEWKRQIEERLNSHDRRIESADRKAESAHKRIDAQEEKIDAALSRIAKLEQKTDRALAMLEKIDMKIDLLATAPPVMYAAPAQASYAGSASYAPATYSYPNVEYMSSGGGYYAYDDRHHPIRWFFGGPIRATIAGFGPTWTDDGRIHPIRWFFGGPIRATIAGFGPVWRR